MASAALCAKCGHEAKSHGRHEELTALQLQVMLEKDYGFVTKAHFVSEEHMRKLDD